MWVVPKNGCQTSGGLASNLFRVKSVTSNGVETKLLCNYLINIFLMSFSCVPHHPFRAPAKHCLKLIFLTVEV
jgi:hypothetical protein